MPQILSTTQLLPKETIGLERYNGLDGQGLPAYATSVDFSANVLEYDVASIGSGRGAQFVTNSDGSITLTPLTLYVQGDESNVPNAEDRITLSDNRTFIVKEKITVHGLLYTRAQPDHFRLRCAVE